MRVEDIHNKDESARKIAMHNLLYDRQTEHEVHLFCTEQSMKLKFVRCGLHCLLPTWHSNIDESRGWFS